MRGMGDLTDVLNYGSSGYDDGSDTSDATYAQFMSGQFTEGDIPVDGTSDGSASAEEYAAAVSASAIAAKAEVENAAVTGRPVSQVAIDTLQSQGISLANILTGAGAAYKLVQSASGIFTAQPANALAQQTTVARRATASPSLLSSPLMLAALAGVAFIALSK